MKKIEAYIRHEVLEPIRAGLYEIGLPSLTVSDVMGSGRQPGLVEHYRGASEILYLRPSCGSTPWSRTRIWSARSR